MLRFWRRLFQPAYRSRAIQITHDLVLHVGEWPARGPRVLCLHGLTANHKCWLKLARTLHRAGYHVVAPDLRGRGRSDKPRSAYNPDVHATDVDLLLHHLGWDDFHILAHSYGCQIAIAYSALKKKATQFHYSDGWGRRS